jgi:putative transposase
MVRHRRNFVAGGTFFFTVALVDRTSRVLIDHIEALPAAMREARGSHALAIHAVVVLPDQRGLLPPDWGGDFSQDQGSFGERRW